jgi:hypothetical protein
MRLTVIRQGHAVFDAGLHPDQRRLMLGDLAEQGHTFTLVEGPHPIHQAGQPDGASHAILHSGPHAAQPTLGLDPATDQAAKPTKAPKAR